MTCTLNKRQHQHEIRPPFSPANAATAGRISWSIRTHPPRAQQRLAAIREGSVTLVLLTSTGALGNNRVRFFLILFFGRRGLSRLLDRIWLFVRLETRGSGSHRRGSYRENVSCINCSSNQRDMLLWLVVTRLHVLTSIYLRRRKVKCVLSLF